MQSSELSLSPGPAPLARIMRSGRIVACPIDETLLLVIGAGGPLADQLPVEIDEDPETRAVAAIIGWRLPASQTSASHGFAALVPVDRARGTPATLRFGKDGSGKRYIVAPRSISINDIAAMLREFAGQVVDVLGRLVDVLMTPPLDPRKLTAITTLLKAGTARDGYIELLGESHGDAIVLKGWAHDMPTGVCRVIVRAENASIAECSIAVYPRNDAPDDAIGFLGLLSADDLPRVRDIQGIFYRGRGAWRYIALHERKLVAGPLETPGHIRALLLQSQSSPQVLLRLRDAASGFDGSETISALPVPVRLGIDALYQGDGGAFLISGWMLDPDDHVESVRLRRGRAEARLDGTWTRTERLDVEDAFVDRPEFNNAISGHRRSHGFIAFADGLAGDLSAPLHLEVTLRDCRRAFMPLHPTRLPARHSALRLLNAIDPTSWALPDIVDRQIVPFLAAARADTATVETVIDIGGFGEAAGAAILVTVSDADEDFAALLGLLALDPQTRQAPIVLALQTERFRRHTARIRRLAEFYRLALRLISVEGSGDASDLAQAAAKAIDNETVILLSASLTPTNPGWYQTLVAHYETRSGSIVSPTLTYEDHSIRWAGSTSLDPTDHLQSSRYAGYPVGAVSRLKLTKVATASLECCILPRKALLDDTDVSPAYLGASLNGMDLSLRLSRRGYESYWLPALQMLGSDEASGAVSPATARYVDRVDQTLFRTRWQQSVEAENTAPNEVSA